MAHVSVINIERSPRPFQLRVFNFVKRSSSLPRRPGNFVDTKFRGRRTKVRAEENDARAKVPRCRGR